MPGDFDERMAELAHMVGDGILESKVEVDQIYAHYQHEGLDFEHPAGGSAKYLERPWMGNATDFGRRWAKGLLEPDGLKEAARGIAEDGSKMVFDNAPFEFGDLRASGHPTVTDDGTIVYDRPPAVARLDKEELKAKSRLHDLGLGNHYAGDWT